MLDFSTRTYSIQRGAFPFPQTTHGSFEDIKGVWLTSSGTKTGVNNRVLLEWKMKRRESILDIITKYPVASELGWQLADELGVAFRDNQPSIFNLR